MKCYKTFVAEDVLTDWSSGMIVVKTIDKKKAIKLILKEYYYYDFIADCGAKSCNNEHCLKHRLRELKVDEIVAVDGGQ